MTETGDEPCITADAWSRWVAMLSTEDRCCALRYRQHPDTGRVQRVHTHDHETDLATTTRAEVATDYDGGEAAV